MLSRTIKCSKKDIKTDENRTLKANDVSATLEYLRIGTFHETCSAEILYELTNFNQKYV